MMKSLRYGVFRVKETIMTTSKLAFALAIALAATPAFALDVDGTAATSDRAAPAVEADPAWYQTGEFKLQAEQARTTLEHQGFPQYIR
jgi:hypothetical protein